MLQDIYNHASECDVIASWSAGDKVEPVECKGLTINLDRGPLKMEVLTDYKCLRPGKSVDFSLLFFSLIITEQSLNVWLWKCIIGLDVVVFFLNVYVV